LGGFFFFFFFFSSQAENTLTKRDLYFAEQSEINILLFCI